MLCVSNELFFIFLTLSVFLLKLLEIWLLCKFLEGYKFVKKSLILGLVVFGFIGLSNILAATLPGSIGDDFLAVGNADRFSVGINYENIRRYVDPDVGENFRLDATSVSLFLGYDVINWLTVFGTLGQSENNSDFVLGQSDDRQFKWSVGVNANLYKWYIKEPKGMAGDRVTVRAFAEFASYEADTGIGNMDWNDMFIALPIAYERFERNDRIEDDSDLFRISIYAGPVLSFVNGSLDTGAGDTDFDADNTFGAIAGIDVYFTRSISIGGQAVFFDVTNDDISARASLRYHF